MKTIVYIDGQNFLYKAADVLIEAGKIKEKQDLHTISIRTLVEKLLEIEKVEIRFYGTKLKKYTNTQEIEAKSIQMINTQRQLRNTLEKEKIIFINSGKLKLRDGDKCKKCGSQEPHFQEKGVDVRIAIDLVVDSEMEDVESLFLISSDTDLVPAVKTVRARGKKMIYVGFSDKLTNGLVSTASETQIIRDNEILDAFEALNPPSLPIADKPEN